jgi:signal transduction histidine kinase
MTRRRSPLGLVTGAIATSTVAMGLIVTAGSLFSFPELRQLHPSLGRMRPETAGCLALLGVALWWLRVDGCSGWRRTAARGCAGVVLAGSLSTLVIGWIGVPVGGGPLAGTALEYLVPLRMPTATAMVLAALALALLLIDTDIRGWRPSEWLASTAGLIALLALVAYGYANLSASGLNTQRSLALHTLFFMIAMAAGIIASRPRRGLMKLLLGEHVTGVMLRRLLPAAVLLPVLLGWLVRQIERLEWLPPVLLLAYYSIAIVVAFVVIVLATARVLYRTDRRRELAEESLRLLNAQLERRIATRTAQLESANRELEAFSYSVSHDLRAPLRAVSGFSRMLMTDAGDRLDPVAQRHLSRINAAAARMGELIDGLLGLARVTRYQMSIGTVDLSALAQTVVADLRQADAARQADVDIAPHLQTAGDQRLLHVALENLIGNAWKFTRTLERARIEIGAVAAERPEGPRTYFVRDNGVGFDMAYSQRLFGAFERLHRESEFEGTGIGLATVKRIVSRHGGRIWVESAPGQGTTFFFTLEPAQPALREQEPVETET